MKLSDVENEIVVSTRTLSVSAVATDLQDKSRIRGTVKEVSPLFIYSDMKTLCVLLLK
jgi:hypothetical protein